MADPRRDRPPSLGELRSHRDAILESAQRHGVLDIRGSSAAVRADRDRLADVLEAIERIGRHTSAGREAFDKDELVQVWVVRAPPDHR
ncbi:MAG: hypothetical protein ACRDSL_00880 [Pseudonocardiaceae bacterium]